MRPIARPSHAVAYTSWATPHRGRPPPSAPEEARPRLGSQGAPTGESVHGYRRTLSPIGEKVPGHPRKVSPVGETVSGHPRTLSSIGETFLGRSRTLSPIGERVSGHSGRL